jgi:DNA topoisomerase-1
MNAQHLYEGIKINGEHTALISYPRTDSTRISVSFSNMVKKFIVDQYGEKYFQFRTYGIKKNESAQDAHEAIRIIDPEITPESLKTKITKDEYALYKLI